MKQTHNILKSNSNNNKHIKLAYKCIISTDSFEKQSDQRG